MYGDLAELWNMDLGGQAMAAVQDAGRPCIDAPRTMTGASSDKQPTISDYADYGIAPDDPYLNAGVLVLDLEQWRNEGIMAECLELATNRQYESHDQDVLNVVLHGKWLSLPPKWNVVLRVYRLRSFQNGPYGGQEFVECIVDPKIIHFTGSCKPWQRLCMHPMARQYWHYLEQTPWKGASPEEIPLRKSFGRMKWKLEMTIDAAFRRKPAYLSHLR